MPDTAGRIFMIPKFVVECGRCGRREAVESDNSKSAPAEIRALGWKFTKADGWVCPDCLTCHITPHWRTP